MFTWNGFVPSLQGKIGSLEIFQDLVLLSMLDMESLFQTVSSGKYTLSELLYTLGSAHLVTNGCQYLVIILPV
jgi:hypothetical protein